MCYSPDSMSLSDGGRLAALGRFPLWPSRRDFHRVSRVNILTPVELDGRQMSE